MTEEKGWARHKEIFPTCVQSKQMVPILNMEIPANEKVIRYAQARRRQVAEGTLPFGIPMVLPSFKARDPSYQMYLTIQTIFFLSTLFRGDSLFTFYGMVSVFPMTIYTSDEDKARRRGGMPVLVMHRANFRILTFKTFSTSYDVFHLNVYDTHLANIKCEYSAEDDIQLFQVTGFDRYTSEETNRNPAFFIISAEWVDVMRHYFCHWFKEPQKGRHMYGARDIYGIFQQAFDKVPFGSGTLQSMGRLKDEYRIKWVGDERTPYLFDVMTCPDEPRSHSMTRSRPSDGKTHLNDEPFVITVKCAKTVQYDEHCFSYGISCWKEQLEILNTAFTYFTRRQVDKPYHMYGLFEIQSDQDYRDRAVLTKAQSLKRGFVFRSHIRKVSRATRNFRYEFNTKVVDDLFPEGFFGSARYYRPKKRQKLVKSVN